MRHLKWSILLCALLMSGCSIFSKKTGQEPMDLESFKETAKLSEVWSSGVGDGQGIGLTQLTPAVDADKIYTVDNEGIVTALNRQNGKKLWSRNVTKETTGLSGKVVHVFKARDLNQGITGGIGYADGYSRRFGNGAGKMMVQGKLAPVIGTVCMDMTMIDITDIDGVKEGDDVIVFGSGIPVQEVAAWIQTIPYEIMTSISQRVKRVYYYD
ncbi:MAG: hypothetical protein EOO01_39365 [Chitinophagaceae bacterium]|nr:MAG: hypothetical protein EOO01_39365 [Chitinophagaceae bacterium]